MELFNPAGAEFWVLVATVIFLAIVWKVGGFSQLTKALDKRAETIRKELDEAKSLREEAQKLLAEYQRKQKEAQAEAEAIVVAAKQEAERFKVESVAKVQDFVARRTKLAEQKIAQAESQALAEVRAAAADAAVSAAASVLSGGAHGAADLMGSAINEVKTKLN